MEKKEFDYVYQMIKDIVLNRPIKLDETTVQSEEVKKLEEALAYLSGCIQEFNTVVHEFNVGNLDAKFSIKQNMLVGELKQLQAVFKHLTWQTQQIANGDYNQKVSTLGDFSASFNMMIQQLKERELRLEESSLSIAKYNQLMKSIIDVNQDWVIVTDQDCNKIVYNNRQALGCSSMNDKGKGCRNKSCSILNFLKTTKFNGDMLQQEYICDKSKRYFNVISYSVVWDTVPSYVHYISDCTKSKVEEKELTTFAYTDELTKIYNRRYCYKILEEYINDKEKFSLSVIDLNGLKLVNDRFGHSYGDQYICDFVYAAKWYIDDSDIFCRVGGDEFIIISKNKNKDELLNTLESISRLISTYFVDKQYSISYGVVYANGSSKYTDDSLVNMADNLMYERKIAYKKKVGLGFINKHTD